MFVANSQKHYVSLSLELLLVLHVKTFIWERWHTHCELSQTFFVIFVVAALSVFVLVVAATATATAAEAAIVLNDIESFFISSTWHQVHIVCCYNIAVVLFSVEFTGAVFIGNTTYFPILEKVALLKKQKRDAQENQDIEKH